MTAIVNGTAILDWEFRTRMGMDRTTLKRIISQWPEMDDRSQNSDEFLAIHNCLNEVCNGISMSPSEWEKWFTYPEARVKQTFAHWLESRSS
jgi:hypothetical protein